MPHSVWEKCVSTLQNELPSQHFNTWIKPLEVDQSQLSSGELRLVAPNRFVLDWVNSRYLNRIEHLISEYNQGEVQSIGLTVRPNQAIARRQNHYQRHEVQPAINNTGNSRPARQPAAQKQEHPHMPVSAAQLLAEEFPIAESDIQKHSDASSATRNNKRDWADFDWSEVQGSDAPVAKSPSPTLFEKPTLDLAGRMSVSPNQGADASNIRREPPRVQVEGAIKHAGNLNSGFLFKSFVEGKSNQLGLAAAQQVAENPGGAYNPLFIYGGVGLGKTHLMHAVGNAMLLKNPNAKVVYLHSERFVADMVKALQLNAINDFKRYYRSVDALLIDDIQFFAGKERSQEEFFHTFNALLEGGQQIILTCDRYPKEIKNLEERLKSRFGWGLTVAVEPPELETRVAILMKKAVSVNMDLPNEAAFFIAQRVRSNVRELEGALKRVIAHSHFTRKPIDVPLVTEALKDLLALQSKQVSIDNIQRVVAEYFKIKVSDLHSKRRSRSVARPRQVAMALAKELTNHSLPEIGEAFGGRDHTTVLHACRKIKELKEINNEMQTDVKNLLRLLTT